MKTIPAMNKVSIAKWLAGGLFIGLTMTVLQMVTQNSFILVTGGFVCGYVWSLINR